MSIIYMMGDSIMRYNKITRYPQFGWGQALNLFTKDFQVIENHAENGRSTKSFMDEGRFDVIYNKLAKGDFVICSFGHNDEKIVDPSRYASPADYVNNLDYYAKKVEDKGATIIFATPVTRHKFVDGVCVETHLDYPQAMLNYCQESKHICIDLNDMTKKLYTKIGEAESAKYHMIFPANTYSVYPEGKEDHSHLRLSGAIMVAGLFVKALREYDCPLNDLLIDLGVEDVIDEKMLKD